MNKKRYRGCLLGGAIGDALGLPYVGLTREQIAERSCTGFADPSETMSSVVPVSDLGDSTTGEKLLAGQWSEDTQLTLALAECLIDEQGIFVPESWAHSLARWVNQGPRAPGISSLQAAIQFRTGGVEWDEGADPEGAGAGPAARSAPIALRWPYDSLQRRRIAVLQASVTHGHPDAQAASLAMSEAIAIALAADRETGEWKPSSSQSGKWEKS